jgi:hypothetical protein
MQTFTFHIDRSVELSELARVAANVFGVSVERVRVIDYDDYSQHPYEWFTVGIDIGLQVSKLAGDFPLEVTVISREACDAPQVTGAFANALSATLLTDEFGVDPFIVTEWSLILPTGEVEKVHIDDEAFDADDPAIILLPAYRKDFEESHRRAAM